MHRGPVKSLLTKQTLCPKKAAAVWMARGVGLACLVDVGMLLAQKHAFPCLDLTTMV
jgi:hypothetical protein